MSVLITFSPELQGPYVFIASRTFSAQSECSHWLLCFLVPLAAFLIFGTQRVRVELFSLNLTELNNWKYYKEILCAWFGRCFPILNDPFVNVLGRRYKRRRQTELFQIVISGAPTSTVDHSVGDSTTTFSVSSYLDKRSPRSPTAFDT